MPQFVFRDVETKNAPDDEHPHQLVAYVVTGHLPLTLEVIYESVSGEPERTERLAGSVFTQEFEKRISNFRRLFSGTRFQAFLFPYYNFRMISNLRESFFGFIDFFVQLRIELFEN